MCVRSGSNTVGSSWIKCTAPCQVTELLQVLLRLLKGFLQGLLPVLAKVLTSRYNHLASKKRAKMCFEQNENGMIGKGEPPFHPILLENWNIKHQDQTAPVTLAEIKRQGLHQAEGHQVSKRSMAITNSVHRNGAHVVDEEVVLANEKKRLLLTPGEMNLFDGDWGIRFYMCKYILWHVCMSIYIYTYDPLSFSLALHRHLHMHIVIYTLYILHIYIYHISIH